MSKELKKFESEFKKIKPKLKTLNASAASALKKRISILHGDASGQGEEVLKESLVAAYAAGVKGTNLTDFMKVKEFKEAYNIYKTATNNLAVEVNKAVAMQKDATAAHAAAAKLEAAIAKDLKSRKDKSKTKSDIESMHDEVKKAMKDFAEAAKVHDSLTPAAKGYVAQFPKKVQAVLKTPPKEAQAALDATILPQLLQDRLLVGNRNKAKKYLGIINSKCDEAMKAAGDNLKAAAAPLKVALAGLKELKAINDKYVKATNDNRVKNQIKDSKDKASIEKSIDFILKAYVAGERKFRGTSTTIKKAG